MPRFTTVAFLGAPVAAFAGPESTAHDLPPPTEIALVTEDLPRRFRGMPSPPIVLVYRRDR